MYDQAYSIMHASVSGTVRAQSSGRWDMRLALEVWKYNCEFTILWIRRIGHGFKLYRIV